jgi:hypothetical protein
MKISSILLAVMWSFLIAGCGKNPAPVTQACRGEECRGKDWALREAKPGDSAIERANAQLMANKTKTGEK